MTITTARNKAAWAIRRTLATKRGCKVMEVKWKECLRKLELGIEKLSNRVADALIMTAKDTRVIVSVSILVKAVLKKAERYLMLITQGICSTDAVKTVWLNNTIEENLNF